MEDHYIMSIVERRQFNAMYEKMRQDAYEFWKNYVPAPLPPAYQKKEETLQEKLENVGHYIGMYQRVHRLADIDSRKERFVLNPPVTLDDVAYNHKLETKYLLNTPFHSKDIIEFMNLKDTKDDEQWKRMMTFGSEICELDNRAINFLRQSCHDAIENYDQRFRITFEYIKKNIKAPVRVVEYDRIWHKARTMRGSSQKIMNDGNFDKASLLDFIFAVQKADEYELGFENYKKKMGSLTWSHINYINKVRKRVFELRHERWQFQQRVRPTSQDLRVHRDHIRRRTGKYFKVLQSSHPIIIGLYTDRRLGAIYDSPYALPYVLRTIVGNTPAAIDRFSNELQTIFPNTKIIQGITREHDSLLRW